MSATGPADLPPPLELPWALKPLESAETGKETNFLPALYRRETGLDA
jgi:hypothetical protein